MSADVWREVDTLLELQSGVISRRQVLGLALHDHDIRRRLRRRDWRPIHPGVYVDHTGTPTWRQRAWAAVLALDPAAICHQSAIQAATEGAEAVDDSGAIHVAVDRNRAVRAPSGVVLHRLAGFDDRVLRHTSPPRLRLEDAVLEVASSARRELDVVATLADAVRSRATTAGRLRSTLDGRQRIARRELLGSLLADVEAGTCSTLEHGYLDRVERPHGLPAARRQLRESGRGTRYRDVDYEEFGLIVELDGRLHHSSTPDRDRDLDRDLDAATLGRLTVRLGWGQVFERPCVTAERLAAVLAARGWGGRVVRCPECPVAQCGGSLAPDESDPPLSA